MKRQIIINTNSLIKSNISVGMFVLLQSIFEKDIDFFDYLIDTNQGFSDLQEVVSLEYVKYTGENFDEALESAYQFDILDFILLEKATKLFETDNLSQKVAEVKDWIQEYRNLFKGIKKNSMGDKNACLTNMRAFLKNNPQYTKEQIFLATKNYIRNTEPVYTKFADYFIYKTEANKTVRSTLLMWLEQEEIQNELSNTESTYTEKI